MSPLVAVAVLLLVAAITPGPNNLIVLRAATRSGMAAAAPAIAGIVAGGLALLAVIVAGADAVFAAEPRLRTVLTLGGSGYLAWLGTRLMRPGATGARASRGADTHSTHDDQLPTGLVALFGFQFLNPKAWVMLATAAAAARGVAFWQLAALFALVSAACLFVWSGLGTLLARLLRRPAVALWFDRAMGASLAASAVALAVEG